MALGFQNDKLLIAGTFLDGTPLSGDGANYRFRPDGTNDGHVRRAWLTNTNTTGKIFYRVNQTASVGVREASATVFDGIVNPGETVDLSFGGIRLVKDVSAFWEGTATGESFRLVGLP